MQQKQLQQGQATWSEVVRKKRRKPPTTPLPTPTRNPQPAAGKAELLRRRLPKTAAVTTDRPAGGGSLAAVMKKVSGAIDLAALGVRVVTTRRTRAGGILLEVDGLEKAGLLEQKIRQVVGETARVRKPERRTPVLLLNVSEWAETEDDVGGLVKVGVVVAASDGNAVSIRKNGGKRDAIALAEAKAVVVGYTRCRVKLLEKNQPTCYRCSKRATTPLSAATRLSLAFASAAVARATSSETAPREAEVAATSGRGWSKPRRNQGGRWA